MKKLKISVFELVWYILSGLIALWGLTYIVLGLVAQYADLPQHNNALLDASNTIKRLFGLDFLGWGMILLVIGVVLAVIVLLAVASKAGKTTEKAARRAARLAKLEADMAEAEANK